MIKTAEYTFSELAEATGGEVFANSKVSGVVIDSRRVQAGNLFVALTGEKFNAHDFVAGAINSGASAAMVNCKVDGVDLKNQILVEDVQVGLCRLGIYARRKSPARFVGITGSVGKTSVKEATGLALKACGEVFVSEGNYNNHIGVPLNLANIPAAVEFAVLEMGMNHAGEIERLTRMVRPHVAIINNVEPAHLEFFASLEKIADAKAEIYSGLEHGGYAVLNHDNQFYGYLADKAAKLGIRNVISFGGNSDATICLRSWTQEKDGAVINVIIDGKNYAYKIAARTKHQAFNTLPALAAVFAIGEDVKQAMEGLLEFSEPAGRGQSRQININGNSISLIDDSYNASPASVKASLAALSTIERPKGRLVVALGDMLELGESSAALHAALADEVINSGASQLITCGQMMKHLADSVNGKIKNVHFADYKSTAAYLAETLAPGDVLLVKGSHGSNMYKVVEDLLKLESPQEKQGKKVAV